MGKSEPCERPPLRKLRSLGLILVYVGTRISGAKKRETNKQKDSCVLSALSECMFVSKVFTFQFFNCFKCHMYPSCKINLWNLAASKCFVVGGRVCPIIFVFAPTKSRRFLPPCKHGGGDKVMSLFNQ